MKNLLMCILVLMIATVTYGQMEPEFGQIWQKPSLEPLFNSIGEPGSFRNHHAPSPGLCAGRDRLLKSRTAVGHSVAHRAVIGHLKITIRKRGRNNATQNLRQFLPALLLTGGPVFSHTRGTTTPQEKGNRKKR